MGRELDRRRHDRLRTRDRRHLGGLRQRWGAARGGRQISRRRGVGFGGDARHVVAIGDRLANHIGQGHGAVDILNRAVGGQGQEYLFDIDPGVIGIRLLQLAAVSKLNHQIAARRSAFATAA